MADRLVQEHAGPARTEHDRHFSGRRRLRFQIDQRLAQCLVHLAPPVRRLEPAVVGRPAARPVGAGLHPAVPLDDDRDIEADQGPDIGGTLPVAADDQHSLPLAQKRRRDLPYPPVLRTGVFVDFLEQLDLALERHLRERVDRGIEGPVRAARAVGKRAAVPGENRAHRSRGPSDGLFGQFRSVGVARRLAGHRAQAETLALVEGRALQPAVVIYQALGLGVFEKQLAIVGAMKRIADKAVHSRAVHAGAVEKQAVGRCNVAHGISRRIGSTAENGDGSGQGKGATPEKARIGAKLRSALTSETHQSRQPEAD